MAHDIERTLQYDSTNKTLIDTAHGNQVVQTVNPVSDDAAVVQDILYEREMNLVDVNLEINGIDAQLSRLDDREAEITDELNNGIPAMRTELEECKKFWQAQAAEFSA